MKKVLLILALISSLWLGGCSNDGCDCDCDNNGNNSNSQNNNSNNNDASLLVGTWSYVDNSKVERTYNYTFNSNYTGKKFGNWGEESFTYEIIGNYICFSYDEGDKSCETYALNNTTLIISRSQYIRS